MQLFTAANVDFWWQFIVVLGWFASGVFLTCLILFLEQNRPFFSLKSAAYVFRRFLKQFWRQLHPLYQSHPKQPNPYLWVLRIGSGFNLSLWVLTTTNLTNPNPSLDAWFWPGIVLISLMTVILSSIQLPKDYPLYQYGRLKQAVSMLAFLFIFGLTVMNIMSLADTTRLTQLLLNQSRSYFLHFKAWYLWSNPISCLLALLLFYDCVLTFKVSAPLPGQFEKNFNFEMNRNQPQLQAHLRLLRATWQLNMILVFIITFTGGAAGFYHSFSATSPEAHPFWLLGKLLLFIGILSYCQFKTLELSYSQFINMHFRILLPLFSGVLWLNLLL